MIVKKKCKQSFNLDMYSFERGEWYEFYEREFDSDIVYFIDNIPLMTKKTLDVYFYSDKALRLIKIRNLLRDDTNGSTIM